MVTRESKYKPAESVQQSLTTVDKTLSEGQEHPDSGCQMPSLSHCEQETPEKGHSHYPECQDCKPLGDLTGEESAGNYAFELLSRLDLAEPVRGPIGEQRRTQKLRTDFYDFSVGKFLGWNSKQTPIKILTKRLQTCLQVKSVL